MHWSVAYVGLPWKVKGRDGEGVDCWGLVRLVLSAEKGLHLPSYADGYDEPTDASCEALAADAKRVLPLVRIDPGQEKEFDLVEFRTGRYAAHIGLVAGGRRMLHISRGRESRLSRYDIGEERPQPAGFYRHEALA